MEKLARRFDELAELERDLLVLPRLAKQADRVADRGARSRQAAGTIPRLMKRPNKKPPAKRSFNKSKPPWKPSVRQLTDALDDLLNHRPEVLEAARKTALEQIAELSKKASALADRQDQLTEVSRSRCPKSRESSGPVAEHQAELVKQAENLKPSEKNPRRGETPQANPLDPEELRKVLEALKAGNLDAAAKQQEAIADRLETLAAELKKNRTTSQGSPKSRRGTRGPRTGTRKRKSPRPRNSQPAENAAPAERKAFEKTLRNLAEAANRFASGHRGTGCPAVQRKRAATSRRSSRECGPGFDQIRSRKSRPSTPRKRPRHWSNSPKTSARRKNARPRPRPSKPCKKPPRRNRIWKNSSRNEKRTPRPKNPPKPEDDEELQRLIQENEEAKRKAAEARKRLEEQLAKNQPEEKLEDELKDLDQLVQKPPASRQSNSNPSAEEIEQLAREARAVEQEIEQLKKKRAEPEPQPVAQAEPSAKPSAGKPRACER